MAFPTIPTAGAGRVLTNVQANTTATRTFPSLSSLTKNSGDLLIAICIAYQTGTGTDAAFSGWTGSFTETADRATTTTMAIGVAHKWSTGSETGTFAVTQAGTITGHACMILLSIPGAHASTVPEVSTKVNATGSNATPSALNPAGWGTEDTLWIEVLGSGEVATTANYDGITSASTNYTNYAETGMSGDVAGAVEGAVAFRQLNAASEQPAADFVIDLTNARNSVLTIAVRPAPAPNAGSATGTIGWAGSATGTRQSRGSAGGVPSAPGYVQLVTQPDSIQTADQNGLDITGDIEFVFCLRLPDWTPATSMVLASKWQADSAAGLSYAVKLDNFSGGQISIWWWDTGVGALESNGIANNGGVDGSHMWIKATLDVNNGTGNSTVAIYTSTDAILTAPASVSWTLKGSSSTEPIATVQSTTQPLWLGLRSTSNDPLTGDYLYFDLKNGIGGTIVARMDARTADPTGSDGLGNSWTLNSVTYTSPVAGAGTIEWAGAATGEMPAAQQGAGTGTIAWAGSAQGTNVHSGAATGTISWAGAAQGTNVHSGSATGTVSWVGAATGVSVHRGASTGAITWAGVATGAVGHSGSATGAISWVGASSGVSTHSGAATGTVAWVGVATGREPASGSATGTIAWVGSATGVSPAVGANDGEGNGTITWAGVATGTNVHSGSASGAISWAGTSTGVALHRGSGTGSISWAGVAQGVSVHRGASTGAITWAGSATGVSVHKGAATGAISWAGTSAGAAVHRGSSSGNITWAGTSTGSVAHRGAATGAITWNGVATGGGGGVGIGAISWSGSAQGRSTHSGSASGAITWAGTASGSAPAVPPKSGAGIGTITWAGTATGITSRAGAGIGTITWAGTATGGMIQTGSATGTIGWAGVAQGVRRAGGPAVGTVTWAGTSTGIGAYSGSATGTITWAGLAQGPDLPPGDYTITIGELREGWSTGSLRREWATDQPRKEWTVAGLRKS